jgi:hypothetical protein
VNAQVLVNTFTDPCSKKVTVFVFPIQGSTLITFMGKSKSFTSSDVNSGVFMTWVNQTYATYSAACPVSQLATQVTTTTVSASVASTVSNVAASASSSVPSPAASGGDTGGSSSNSSSSQSSEESSSSKSSENKSESKSESKDEKKSDNKGGKSKDGKKDSKKEDKKKSNPKKDMAPIVFSSDLSSVQQLQAGFNLIANLGYSRASLAGDVSYGSTAMIWSNLKQFAISSRYSINSFKNGQINGVYTYSLTNAYNNGSFLHIGAFSFVKPIKTNIFGYNLAIVGTSIPYETSKQVFLISSVTVFGMHIMPINRRLSLIPELFFMGTPYSYSMKAKEFKENYQFSYIIGSSVNYQVSKRFGLSGNLKYMGGSMQTIGLLIGSRFNL